MFLRCLVSSLLISALPVSAEVAAREMVYQSAFVVGGQPVPRYDKGYLLYVRDGNRLEVHKPDGTLLYNVQLPCPGTGECGTSSAAVDSRGMVAVGFAYWTKEGRAGGIRLLNAQGGEARFIETKWYVPRALCFDEKGDLWSLGWLRDPYNPEFPVKADHAIVRKFSPEGKELGQYVPRSLWPGSKSSPGSAGVTVNYWTMAAASDRIGALVHGNHADNDAEWVEWDLQGNLLSRTVVPKRMSAGRAFTSDGKFYARFPVNGGPEVELRVLDRATGKWTAIAANLPEYGDWPRAFLLGAHDRELVYRVGPGNVHIMRVAPGAK